MYLSVFLEMCIAYAIVIFKAKSVFEFSMIFLTFACLVFLYVCVLSFRELMQSSSITLFHKASWKEKNVFCPSSADTDGW